MAAQFAPNFCIFEIAFDFRKLILYRLFFSLYFGLLFCLFRNSSQLPARSTRLLNRSRLQPTLNGSESPRSIENLHLINCKTQSQFGRDSANGSPDEQLFMLDKTLRNSMIQDVQYCKQQLLQLRSILQEVSVHISKPKIKPFCTSNQCCMPWCA